MMSTSTRERIVGAAAELMRQQGFAGTGMKQILSAAGAPFGSLYHFFPAGKQQLATEVVRSSGAVYLQLYHEVAGAGPNITAGVDAFFAGARDALVTSDFADACPIATVASEVANTNDDLRQACEQVFESWLAALQLDLVEGGVLESNSRALALSVLSALEGAFLLCRTLRSPGPMDAARSTAQLLIASALEQAGPAS